MSPRRHPIAFSPPSPSSLPKLFPTYCSPGAGCPIPSPFPGDRQLPKPEVLACISGEGEKVLLLPHKGLGIPLCGSRQGFGSNLSSATQQLCDPEQSLNIHILRFPDFVKMGWKQPARVALRKRENAVRRRADTRPVVVVVTSLGSGEELCPEGPPL